MDVALGCLLAANAWRTAGWTAQRKRWIWPWGSFCLRGWALRIDVAWGVAFACAAMDLALG